MVTTGVYLVEKTQAARTGQVGVRSLQERAYRSPLILPSLSMISDPESPSSQNAPFVLSIASIFSVVMIQSLAER